MLWHGTPGAAGRRHVETRGGNGGPSATWCAAGSANSTAFLLDLTPLLSGIALHTSGVLPSPGERHPSSRACAHAVISTTTISFPCTFPATLGEHKVEHDGSPHSLLHSRLLPSIPVLTPRVEDCPAFLRSNTEHSFLGLSSTEHLLLVLSS